MQQIPVPRRKTMLVILDGFGVNPSKKNNAICEANTPNFDTYFSKYPHTTLQASGGAVGLPGGQMGNSEVGHFTLGCGRIYDQDLVRIDRSIKEKKFYTNVALVNAVSIACKNHRPIHLIGLVSDGGIHSHTDHLFALIKLCAKQSVKAIVHVITDGRDTSPKSAKVYIESLLGILKKYGGSIGTITGRFYAMDRDNRWGRTEKAWRAIVIGKGMQVNDPLKAIDEAYAMGQTDEFITPRIVGDFNGLERNDVIIFFNFRNDRPRQLAKALRLNDFDGFDRGEYDTFYITCLTEYDKKLLAPVAFSPKRPATNLSHQISLSGHKQFHCAETEKYAHVTFFFNGGRETPYAGENRVMVNSPKVQTYDEKPSMSAKAVTDSVMEAIDTEQYGFIVVNFANGDMVGHTAIKNAVIEAVETLDTEVGRLLDYAVENEYSIILTSDHGNCDEYIDPMTGGPHTQHTLYPVPCLIIDKSYWKLATCGGLRNVAPTVLELMGLHKPRAMKGTSLLMEEYERKL